MEASSGSPSQWNLRSEGKHCSRRQAFSWCKASNPSQESSIKVWVWATWGLSAKNRIMGREENMGPRR